MKKQVHSKVCNDEAQKNGDVSAATVVKLGEKITALSSLFKGNLFAILFFAVVWALLAFYESALLFRVNELSVFLYDNVFYNEMMSMPAGILYYVASFLVQFFYIPVLGATIYVALLALVYWLTYKVFDISPRFRLLAMLPVVALLASNTELGYWIFYMKIPGYYYVALLGVLVALLAALVVKKAHKYIKPLLVVAWIYFAYPCIGVYALASGVLMGVQALFQAIGEKRIMASVVWPAVLLLVAVVTAYVVPQHYYKHYTTVPREEMYAAGLPVSQWRSEYVPDNEDKTKIVSVIDGVNGRVGYPVQKVLTKFKINVDGSFSQKAINTAKADLFDSGDINRPVDGKRYTFVFVGKDGEEHYLNEKGGEIALAVKDSGANIPKSAQFVCVADKKIKDVVYFKTQGGKYLVWEKRFTEDSGKCLLSLKASSSSDNARFAVGKMMKGDGVQVADNSELFGLVNLCILENDSVASRNKLQFVAEGANEELVAFSAPVYNDEYTSALRIEEVGFEPVPFQLEMQDRSMWFNINVCWIPFFVLLLAFLLLAATPVASHCCAGCKSGVLQAVLLGTAALLMVGFAWLFWYGNENFRIENEQNRAMWNEDWRTVAELARETDMPTRQVVMNKNIALLKLGNSGAEMFGYPEGSADIEASVPVRLAQTGGKMAYFQYGKFNFCYRWCVEDAVEYGWRIEYLKHAVRSMLLAGEYRLAERYINILKRTMFYDDWACEMEKYLNNPETLSRNREFMMPLNMTCYDDFLDVDESYVEAYLTKNLANASEKMSRVYVEAALASVLTRKDAKSFWFFLNYYVNELRANALPRHYQEAVLLFLNVDKGRTVQVPKAFLDKFVSVSTNTKMTRFMQLVSQHKGKSEAEMAPYFEEEFGDTYFYFYFFVRNIKTN